MRWAGTRVMSHSRTLPSSLPVARDLQSGLKEAELTCVRWPDRGKRARAAVDFKDGFLPYAGPEVKKIFEELKQSVAPDLIFTHNRNDAHQDHRMLAELTWNTFRDHMILEYEIPKYDGDMGRPGVFVPLTAELCEKKIRFITDTFQSQSSKLWFQPETFRSLMRLRGMECNAPSGYAEAFFCRKLVL